MGEEKNLALQANSLIRKTLFMKLSFIFLAKEEISEAYANVPAKSHVNHFISMSVRILSQFCLSVAQFCVWLFERTIKAGNMRFSAKCRH